MKKKQLIEEFLAKPFEKGERVYVKGLGSQNKEAYHNTAIILSFKDEETITFRENSRWEKEAKITDLKKYTHMIGEDPIDESMWRKVQNINYTLDSVLFKLGLGSEKTHKENHTTKKGFEIKVCNFNPFIEINGEKKYYQRPFVWTLEEMQALVHSIYNRVDCGKIVIRNRGWEWLHSRELEEDCYWYDVIDGVQRLSTIQKFLNNEFTDKFGNYFEDLSDNAQHRFTDHQLFSYAEMAEDTTDEDVLKQFLSINFSGVPQSKEHIEYVESLLKK
jgi:hypothetical protein